MVDYVNNSGFNFSSYNTNYDSGFNSNDYNSQSSPSSGLFVGVEADFVPLYGVELGAGIVANTDNLSDSGVYGSIGDAAGANIGAGFCAGYMDEFNGPSKTFDISYGPISVTLSGTQDETNGPITGFNGIQVCTGAGLGGSVADSVTETATFSDAYGGMETMWDTAEYMWDYTMEGIGSISNALSEGWWPF